MNATTNHGSETMKRTGNLNLATKYNSAVTAWAGSKRLGTGTVARLFKNAVDLNGMHFIDGEVTEGTRRYFFRDLTELNTDIGT